MSDRSNDVGVLLRTEREKRGLTLEMIHETTKIPLDALRAIEEGYKIRTLTPFYYKSFVKLYAQHLALDPVEVLGKIPVLQPAKADAAAEKVARVQKTPAVNIALRSMDPKRTKKILSAALVVFGGIVLVLVLFSIIQKVREYTSSVKVKRVEEPARKAEPVKKPVAAVKPPTVEAPGSMSKVSLVVRAPVKAWITVKADGKPVFQGVLRKGSADSWSADKNIELSGRDIDKLEFEINGKMVGEISRRGMNIRRIIITPQGFSVEK